MNVSMILNTVLDYRVVSREEMLAWPVDRDEAPPQTWTSVAWPGDQLFHANIWPNRIVFEVSEEGEVARAEAVWRRSGRSIRFRGMKLIAADTGEVIKDAVVVRYDQERIVIDFRPVAGLGRYDLYFGAVGEPRFAPSEEWLRQLPAKTPVMAVPQVVEARCRLDSFAPMEIIALPEEVEALLANHPGAPYLVFPEDRDRSIKLTREIPAHWAINGPHEEVILRADRNEYRVFQLGIWACRKGVADITVLCSDLKSTAGDIIPKEWFQCLTLESRCHSALIAKPKGPYPVPQGGVRALWCGLDLPEELAPGEYAGTLTVQPVDQPAYSLPLRVTVTGHVAKDRGDHDLWRLSRLRWLDSDAGLSDAVYPPYTPLRVEGRAVSTWGHTLRIDENGLPDSLRVDGRSVLASPVALTAAGVRPDFSGCALTETTDGHVCWESNSAFGEAHLNVRGRVEFDGCAIITLQITVEDACRLEDLALNLRWRPEHAWLAAGMGYRGKREGDRAWRHIARGAKGFDPMLWLGSIEAGLGFATWETSPWEDAARADAALITENDEAVTLRLNLGMHEITPEHPWQMTFALLPTPVKPPDPRHWDFRYMHLGGGFSPGEHDTPQSFLQDNCARLDEAAAMGVKRLNLHDWWGPAFNYPWQWDGPDNLSRLTEEAHQRGMFVKAYNSGRELSTNAPEFWGMVYEGTGYDFSADRDAPNPRLHAADAWHENHLPDGLPKGWPRVHEAGNEHAVPVSNATRIGNFYLESMRYMTQHFGTDGAYWDGADGPTLGHREMAKRLWTIFRETKPEAATDVHHGNTLLDSPIVQHMLVLPFIDSIWHGEGFPYDAFDPWAWLVEIAGLPFGVPSELLGGEEYFGRAMLFGIWPRMGWCAGTEKQEKLWQFFDRFDIRNAEMRGWWTDNGVTLDRPDIKVTAFCHPENGVLLVIGCWHQEIAAWMEMTLDVSLLLDRGKLGLPGGELRATDILTGEDVNISRSVLLPDHKAGRMLWVR